MTAEIVNLRKARKQKLRADKEALAAENRVRFGRTKSVRSKEEEERLRIERELDGARRDGQDGGSDDGNRNR